MMNMKKHLKWLWVPLIGILNFLFFALSVIMNGGGHGLVTPLVIAMSPLMVLTWLTSALPLGDWGFLVMYLLPFYWMGEVVLALCRNKYCKWAFLLLVLGRYIHTIILVFCWDSSKKHYLELFSSVIVLLAPYIVAQLLLWIVFLQTWGRIRFVIRPAEPPSF